MDIDEFLDREIGAEKEDISDTEEVVAVKAIREGEKIVNRYFELWGKVSEAKLEWNDKLYAELNNAANMAKTALGSLVPTTEKEKNIISRLLNKALDDLENRKYDSATKLYSEISDMRNNIPEFLLEQRRDINKEIFHLYEKLHDRIDSKFINDFKGWIGKVEMLINSSFSNLQTGRIEDAIRYYENALGIYKSLPNGFLAKKLELGNVLLLLYKELSIEMQIRKLQQHRARKSSAALQPEAVNDSLKALEEKIKKRIKASEESPSFSYLIPPSAQKGRHT
ncbi:hypothetical protein KY347_05920 [Candidatus Woesearchaeota archaeon]|nr:hypothetical protein [Candidatus Woesearchaeota archaeon]